MCTHTNRTHMPVPWCRALPAQLTAANARWPRHLIRLGRRLKHLFFCIFESQCIWYVHCTCALGVLTFENVCRFGMCTVYTAFWYVYCVYVYCVYGICTMYTVMCPVYTHSRTCVLCIRTGVFVHCVYAQGYPCGVCPVYTNSVHTFDNVYPPTPHSYRRFGASARRMRAILRRQLYLCSYVFSYVFLCVPMCLT